MRCASKYKCVSRALISLGIAVVFGTNLPSAKSSWTSVISGTPSRKRIFSSTSEGSFERIAGIKTAIVFLSFRPVSRNLYKLTLDSRFRVNDRSFLIILFYLPYLLQSPHVPLVAGKRRVEPFFDLVFYFSLIHKK